MAVIKTEVDNLIQASDTAAKVFLHSFTNPRIINAHISYFPHGDSAEDTIDFSINLTMRSEKNGYIDCDICRSNGEVIFEILGCEINAETEESFLIQIDQLSQEAVRRIMRHLTERGLDFVFIT